MSQGTRKDTFDTTELGAARLLGFDLVFGRAVVVGDDDDGNSLYDINGSSIFNPDESIAVVGVVPQRWYAGVKVTQPEPQAPCIGVRVPWLVGPSGDHWYWFVLTEVIDWGECE